MTLVQLTTYLIAYVILGSAAACSQPTSIDADAFDEYGDDASALDPDEDGDGEDAEDEAPTNGDGQSDKPADAGLGRSDAANGPPSGRDAASDIGEGGASDDVGDASEPDGASSPGDDAGLPPADDLFGEGGLLAPKVPGPASPDNPMECPPEAPENPIGSCLGVPVYATCTYGTYACICDWFHWICI